MLRIVQCFKDYKIRQAEKEARDEKEEERRKAEAFADLKDSRVQLQTKPCPFMDLGKCRDTCVHFDRGSVRIWAGLSSDRVQYFVEPASCKLWKKS